LVDYLILLGVWSLNFIAGALNPTLYGNKSVLSLQIRETLLIWSFYLLFLHGIRVIENPKSKKYRIFTTVFLIYVLLLQILIIFWKELNQGTITQFGIDFKPEPGYEGDGVGIGLINDFILYSSGHTFLRDVLTTIVSVTLLYSYFKVKPIHPTDRIQRAHSIWKIVSISLFLVTLLDSWLWRFTSINPNLAGIFIFISATGIVIVSVFYPEAVLISQSQIYRISNLYDLIEKLTSKQHVSRRTKELVDYLENLPKSNN
jgi:hypothetical protein